MKNVIVNNLDLDDLVEKIQPLLIFKDMVKISMKKAIDQSINIEERGGGVW